MLLPICLLMLDAMTVAKLNPVRQDTRLKMGICPPSPLPAKNICVPWGGTFGMPVNDGPHACAGRFCVYANPSFGQGKGMVMITTADNMEQLSWHEQFHGGPPDSSRDGGLFKLAPIPGKGLGLVATQLIRRGQMIMTHMPAVISHRALIDELSKSEQHRLFDEARQRLPAKTRAVFLAQMGHQNSGHHSTDVMYTNSFELSLPIDDFHHFGNFPDVSRFNHDCRPNVAFHIEAGLVHTTHAVVDIPAGTELTITYIESLRVRSVRQDRTRRSWGFTCACPHCSVPDAVAHASDHRLGRIVDLEQKLTDLSTPGVSIDTVDVLLSLYRQERLESHAATPYTLAALNYNAFGREDLAVKYALLSLEQGLLENGPNAEDVQMAALMMHAPREHWSWERRIGRAG